MSRPIGFEIDTTKEHTEINPQGLGYEEFTCPRHGDIGKRVFRLAVKDDEMVASTGVFCMQCFANMLSCCSAEPKLSTPEDDTETEEP